MIPYYVDHISAFVLPPELKMKLKPSGGFEKLYETTSMDYVHQSSFPNA